MPAIEDFPRPAQEQLRQARGEGNQAEARRRSLFDRIAAFGASRQEEAYDASFAEPASAPRAPRSQPPQPPQPSPAHAEYAKRVSAQANAAALRAGADQQARRAAPTRNVEEDHLEIPAFLRRQANR
jgi:cell division protein FtsZ